MFNTCLKARAKASHSCSRINMKNKLTTSYGLVVKTSTDKIVLLRRKVPYCVQDFFHYLHKKKIPYESNQKIVHEWFEKKILVKLPQHDIIDYQRYKNNDIFEDMYDFPHGQLPYSVKRRENINTISLFRAAYREFEEETGFHFDLPKSEIENLPMVHLTFRGLNGIVYEQHYFLIENVKHLKRHSYFNSFTSSHAADKQIKSWTDDRLIYHGQVVSMNRAFKQLMKQQDIKSDLKQLLCLKSLDMQNVLDELLVDREKNNRKEFDSIEIQTTL